MTYSVYQPWDPLRVCALGRFYPREFFSFVEHPSARYVLERMSDEVEEDLQNCISLLSKFNVNVVRTSLNDNLSQYYLGDRYLPAPLTPRDDTGMVGNTYFTAKPIRNQKWEIIRGEHWPIEPPQNLDDWNNLSSNIKDDLKNFFGLTEILDLYDRDHSSLAPLANLVEQQGNQIIYNERIDTAMTCRLGKDLYFGTWPNQDKELLLKKVSNLFPDNRCHIIQSDGHLDGVICPVVPGLIFSSRDMKIMDLKRLFPDWEIHFVDQTPQSSSAHFRYLRQKNGGRWWVPGQESNDEFTKFVEKYIANWTGFCEETVIGVNLLVIDEKNVICLKEDEKAFKKFEKYGITPHVVKFRHYNFFDSGWHCLTSDLHREGRQKDYFPERQQ